MEFVVGCLALVGVVSLVLLAVGFGRSAKRVLEAVNAIGANGIEVVSAIEAVPADDQRQFAALARWEAACGLVRALSPKERERVARMLDSRNFPMREVGQIVASFIEQADRRHEQVDRELASMAG